MSHKEKGQLQEKLEELQVQILEIKQAKKREEQQAGVDGYV